MAAKSPQFLSEPWIPHPTADGSFTFFSPTFAEAFHSTCGAKTEALGKFVQPAQLLQRAAQGDRLCLLDICYGLGYNLAAALTTLWQSFPSCRVEIWALDLSIDPAQQAIAAGMLPQWPEAVQTILQELAQCQIWQGKQGSIRLLLGDARQTIGTLLAEGCQAEVIFLDPFSPPRCPQLWTVEFLAQVSHCLDPQGCLVTYSAAAAVRQALRLAGLQLCSTPAVGRRAPGTLARWQPPADLSPKEEAHLQTRAGIPYRDPSLRDSARVILERRQQEQAHSDRESTSAWQRRWQGQA